MEKLILEGIKLIKRFYKEEGLELKSIYSEKEEIIIEDRKGRDVVTIYNIYRIIEIKRIIKKERIEKALIKAKKLDDEIEEIIFKLIKKNNIEEILKDLKKISQQAMRKCKINIIYECKEFNLEKLISKIEIEKKLNLEEIKINVDGNYIYLGENKEKILKQIKWINNWKFKKPVILFIELKDKKIIRIELKDKIRISFWNLKNKNFYEIENSAKLQKYIDERRI